MSLKDAFLGMKEAREPEPAAELRIVSRAASKSAVKVGKSADPDFEPVKIYLRKQTHKAARRRWEDGGNGDFSELVEQLLRNYLDT